MNIVFSDQKFYSINPANAGSTNFFQRAANTVIPRLTRFLWQPKNRVRRNSRYASLYYVKYFCKIIIPKNRVMQIIYSIGMYKTVLCKFFWTSSKIRAMGNRAIENRVSRGMTVFSAIWRYNHN